jgi:hypothetical protein
VRMPTVRDRMRPAMRDHARPAMRDHMRPAMRDHMRATVDADARGHHATCAAVDGVVSIVPAACLVSVARGRSVCVAIAIRRRDIAIRAPVGPATIG